MKLDPDDRLLTFDEVQRMVIYSKVHVYRLMRRGEFPKQIHLGPNRVAWRESDILKWIDERDKQYAA